MKNKDKRNLDIAYMLGYKPSNNPYKGFIEPCVGSFKPEVISKYIEKEKWSVEPLFHEDWNWLMLAVDFIEELSAKHPIYEISVSIFTTNRVLILISDRNDIAPAWRNSTELNGESKMDAIFEAVSDFAKLYLTGFFHLER